ncbi:MAG: hypothetical protein HXX81_00025 [Campylobacterales bacterium]|nr:hypothetical protein [Campylobacterales bacterium]
MTYNRDFIFKISFLAFIIVLWIIVLNKTTANFEANIKVDISKTKNQIKSINDNFDIAYTKSYDIDVINFKNSNELVHEKLGNLGFNDNFFCDFKSKIDVSEDIKIVIYLYSDDGFKFFIDSIKYGEFINDRAFSLSKFEIPLTKGIHEGKILYFQGYGQLGIKVEYEVAGKKYLWGENSKYIKFLKV